ncbi:MAG: phenylalanine--tRNA ligase subunit beta, partial [Epulopiscium sp.]|nr:phenylalanine--tRNA ligase subunit beta [Candidatus Epulonipiscium sp.]
MNISMSWLKKYVPIDCDIKTYIHEMTMSGTNVESYEELGAEINNVVVGKITSIQPHPNADRLVITMVDVGTETLQIVTGATNISEGDIVPVALHGSTLADGVKIKKGKLRGIESNGMLCSVEELGFKKGEILDAPEDGIYIFKENIPLGSDIKPYFGLDDTVVEYEITSNRSDCYNVLGVAREAAATFKKPFLYPKIKVTENDENVQDYV